MILHEVYKIIIKKGRIPIMLTTKFLIEYKCAAVQMLHPIYLKFVCNITVAAKTAYNRNSLNLATMQD
jgi:hypothetical protein